tara:strand:- start:40 stop:309 length:270 start_codon:yes stop_codon:yes gene_type:complete
MPSVDYSSEQSNNDSKRRQRLHELLIALLNNQHDLELMDGESPAFDKGICNNKGADPALLLERNRRIINRYQSLVRSAIALDALLDSER